MSDSDSKGKYIATAISGGSNNTIKVGGSFTVAGQ
jgi:hypothetical protein